jgi:RNA-binding protein FUS
MIGQVAKKKQRRGFPDQWPWKVSIYRDDAGKPKGDATLTFVDPNAAQTAPGFFNNTEFKGSKITVEMAAEKTATEPSRDGGGGRGWQGGNQRGSWGGDGGARRDGRR